ncbi:hypothetical protein, partial [Pseudomonas aeruginosa]|uniref:hypothetical protein n=1 Tax=Pseudomonas aeruginosa TaxID=287 RepID=UPI001F299BB1
SESGLPAEGCEQGSRSRQHEEGPVEGHGKIQALDRRDYPANAPQNSQENPHQRLSQRSRRAKDSEQAMQKRAKKQRKL